MRQHSSNLNKSSAAHKWNPGSTCTSYVFFLFSDISTYSHDTLHLILRSAQVTIATINYCTSRAYRKPTPCIRPWRGGGN